MEFLNDFQKEILEECKQKGSGGLSLPMGSGKTIISLVLSLQQENHILIVTPKTLLKNWESEIKKFFKDTIKYVILHQEYIKNIYTWNLEEDVRIVITTGEVLSGFYKRNNVELSFIESSNDDNAYFRLLKKPVLNKNRNIKCDLYTTKWGFLIIDEIHKFTNIATVKCKSIASICAEKKWGLSGTMFEEPVGKRIQGYHILLDDPFFPRNVIIDKFFFTNEFEGVNKTMVIREKNIEYVKPDIKRLIIKNELTKEEIIIYTSLKNIMVNISDKIKKMRVEKDIRIREFNGYLLVIISYLRQSLVCPLLPISRMFLNMLEYNSKSELSKYMREELEKYNLKKYLNDVESIKSSRIKKCLEIIDKHKSEKVIVFLSFRGCLKILESVLSSCNDRKIYSLESNMSMEKRNNVLKEFEKSDNGILLLTFSIGSEGLNLQFCKNILLLDFWWNDGKTEQAISRIDRYGQESKNLNVYYFTSNTNIENFIFKKQNDKKKIGNSIKTGSMSGNVTKINSKIVCELVSILENTNLILELNE